MKWIAALGAILALTAPLAAQTYHMGPPSGGDDCAIANAALLTNNQVIFDAYGYNNAYRCASSITNLVMGKGLAGSAAGNTYLRQEADITPIVISDATRLNPTGPNILLTISNLTLQGEKTIYSNPDDNGITALYPIEDLQIENVLITNFAGWGLHAVGGWGYLYDNFIAEFNSLGGVWESNEACFTFTGIMTGAFPVGDTVSQENTGAIGKVLDDPLSAGETRLRLITLSGTFDPTDPIHDSAGNYFTPASRYGYASSGPKITRSKIRRNGGAQFYLGSGLTNSIVSNSEFDANTPGQCGEILNGAQGTKFEIDRFDAIVLGASCYIQNGSAVGSPGTQIIGSSFLTLNDSEQAIIMSDASLSWLVNSNEFDMDYANPSVNPILLEGSRFRGTLGTNIYYNEKAADISAQFYYYPAKAPFSEKYYAARYAAYSNASTNWPSDKSVTLPPATVGMVRAFLVARGGSYLKFNAQPADIIDLPSGGTTAPGGYLHSAALGSKITVYVAAAGEWQIVDLSNDGPGWCTSGGSC